MTLHLQYQVQTKVPVEVEGIVPNVVRSLSLAEIERLPVYHGNQLGTLADFFRVSGDPTDQRMEWEGELAGVHWIGTQMAEGVIHVAGNAGRHVGSEMTGGEIHVTGNAGDWVGGEMHGGLIHIRGRAGHLIGAAYRGSARGMTHGTILIHGDVGNEVGHTMRRGLIAVGGNAGDLAGFNMLAGTLLFCGAVGIRHGAGMKRGTLAFFGDQPPPLLPTYRKACRFRPEILAVLFRQLRAQGFPLRDDFLSAMVDLYNGDFLNGGRGEILIRAQS